jgi:arginine/ornithine transport system permease protein
MLDFHLIAEHLPLYGRGLLVTFQLLLIALALGLALAIPLGLMRVSRSPWLNAPAWLYTYVIRGTPMLVQLFLIYYGLAQFAAIRDSFLWPYFSSATFCACLAFAINTSAYSAEILAGSLKATPQYSNEVIMMLHTTSLASIVTLIDITGAARTLSSRYYMPFEAFITAGVFYLVLTFALVQLFKGAERRWLAYLTPRKA